MKKRMLIIPLLVVGLVLTSCGGKDKEDNKKAGRSVVDQQRAVTISQERQNKTQPPKIYGTSVIKQVLMDVEDIQATGAVSTTQMFLEGVGMIGWFPSVGSPVPASWQLSPSKQ